MLIVRAVAVLSLWIMGGELSEVCGQHADPEVTKVLITNARVFDGKADRLSGPMHVLVTGNIISEVAV